MASLRNLGGQRGRVEERLHLNLSNRFTDIHACPLSAAS